jgi:protein SCO1/2
MKTKILTAMAALLVCGASAADKTLPPCCANTNLLAATNYTDKSLFNLDSVWTSDTAKQIKLGTLRGKPQVVAMFFASCQYTCPLTIHDLKGIESALPANLRTNVGFVLVSFDSERDTPAALTEARKKHDIKGANWTLLRGDTEDVRELAAMLGVSYRKDANGQFAHSNVITVLNSEGEIVFQQPGLNLPPDVIVAKLEAMLIK